MPSVEFEARLIFDYDFYNEVIKKDPKLLTKLMYINARSKGYKRVSNIISKKIFERILKENPSMPRSLLRASFYYIEEEELEEVGNEIERTIKYAIHVVDQPPRKSFIMTSPSKVTQYEQNPHYNGVKEISVKSGEEAITIIDDYFRSCTAK